MKNFHLLLLCYTGCIVKFRTVKETMCHYYDAYVNVCHNKVIFIPLFIYKEEIDTPHGCAI